MSHHSWDMAKLRQVFQQGALGSQHCHQCTQHQLKCVTLPQCKTPLSIKKIRHKGLRLPQYPGRVGYQQSHVHPTNHHFSRSGRQGHIIRELPHNIWIFTLLGDDEILSVTHSSTKRATTADTFSLESSVHMSSGFSCCASYMWTAVLGESRIWSTRADGRILRRMSLTLGPTSLSQVILPISSAVFSLTSASSEEQKRLRRLWHRPNARKPHHPVPQTAIVASKIVPGFRSPSGESLQSRPVVNYIQEF
ncbi:hypothetical protein E2C01_019913 [Portunus trituberculatus]|uniref:Uncharacterized protein n=1 Tax=Portunus trituberculatus TaxID=210409 RepID=A0A5B7E0P8_PORTR|nr:hypothetical protein [Portunus trituberculatus]